MSVEPELSSAPSSNDPSESENVATSHLALARCRDVYEKIISSAPEGMKAQLYARKDAVRAYKSALPPLVGAQNIRDFIACIAQGMLLGIIYQDEGASFLSAARVAQSALRNTSGKQAR